MKILLLISCICLTTQPILAQRSYSHLIGQQAPPIRYQLSLDKKVSPDFYKGKVLVLDFWATWCAPCIASFPHINQLSESMGNSEIVFATLTDEPETTVKTFFKRTGKILKPLKLLDTAKQTTKAFGIEAIPVTIVVNKMNTIAWAGLTSELTEDIIKKALNGESLTIVSPSDKKKLRNRPIAQRAAFSFSAAIADTSKENYEDIGLTYRMKDRIIMLSEGNIRLDEFLEKLLGYSKAARFITNDTSKISKRIDVFFKSDGDSTLFTEYRNLFLPNDPRKNLLLLLLSQTFKFSLEFTTKKQKVLELVVADDKKLRNFGSMQTERQSFSTDYLPKVEIVGYSLSQTAMALENVLKIAVFNASLVSSQPFDLSLDVTNRDSLRRSLLFHGLDVKETERELDMVNIIFH